jgi:hypothetical protein
MRNEEDDARDRKLPAMPETKQLIVKSKPNEVQMRRSADGLEIRSPFNAFGEP